MARDEQAFYHNANHERQLRYVQGVRSGGFLFMSGVTSIDSDGRVVHPGDMSAQTRYIYRRIQDMLSSQGLPFSSLIKEVVYTTDMEAWRAAQHVRHEIFAGMVPPAGSVVEVTRLFDPGVLVEIEVIAECTPAGVSREH
jgi:enamine deaminase RidA (YjgF/YER057c/UK114 family)